MTLARLEPENLDAECGLGLPLLQLARFLVVFVLRNLPCCKRRYGSFEHWMQIPHPQGREAGGAAVAAMTKSSRKLTPAKLRELAGLY